MPWNPQPTLVGTRLTMRPLTEADFEALYAVASDPLIWEQHPARTRYQREVFRAFVDEALAGGSAFVAVDNATGAIIGSSRYNGFSAETSEVEIGWSFLSRAHWGGRWNHEMKRLMLDHAFGSVDRVTFHIGPDNIRSQTAVKRIGGELLGLFNDDRGERVVFAITRDRWPVLREQLLG